MIDKDKQYRTRDGREVRIYATGVDNSWPVHGARKDGDRWCICAWKSDGRADSQPTSLDLIEVKPRIKREYWINIYPKVFPSTAWSSKYDADYSSNNHARLACVKVEIDCEEGEGL